MKNLIILAFAFAALVSCKQAEEKTAGHDMAGMTTDSVSACCSTKDGLFLHISSGYDNPHKALMALKMASMMAMEKPVAVYIDIEGVKMLVNSSKDMTYSDFPPLFELLDELVKMKVPVMACPACLKVAGFQPEDLRPGITIANKDTFFNFTKGRILTLDY
jgi:predicted peroxiredoxin